MRPPRLSHLVWSGPMGRGRSRPITSRLRSRHWGSGGGLNVCRCRRGHGAWALGGSLEPTDLSGCSMRGRGAPTDPISSLGHLHVAAAAMDMGGPRGPPGVWLWPRKVWTAAGQHRGCQGAGPGSRDFTGHFRCTRACGRGWSLRIAEQGPKSVSV